MHTVLRVALPLPRPAPFDYLPPDACEPGPDWIGCRVRVPFGRRELVGFVVDAGPATGDPARLRAVLARLDPQPLLPAELWTTLQWAARYYHAPLGELLATALPAPLRAGEPPPDPRTWGWRLTPFGAEARLRSGSAPARLAARLASGLLAEDAIADGERDALRSLRQRGHVERVEIAAPPSVPTAAPPPPTPAQAEAIAAIGALSGFQPVLLEGVTGSGKTEVYLSALAACVARGRQALVLVPEIGLAPQALRRFRARLPVPVLALHSGLADGERARVWAQMASGRPAVLVGTRSAVFSPLPAAGLIVVDEEHDGSYKQHDGVRYSARDLAMVRGRALDVPVVLGSATPALETLVHAQAGRYLHLRLRQRAGAAQPPAVKVIDLRRRQPDGGLTPELRDAIAACMARGEQALIFRNRRGYAPVLLCHDCGWSARCRRCEAPQTVHARGRRLICHHCGSEAPPPRACPDCQSLALQPQGVGTERVEDALAAAFPNVPLIRVDRETTRQRDGLDRHLERLGDQAGILVGTQILAKGHDLPRLTLVGVVGIDEGLFSADFRAPERLAQLLIQVSGRAGRSERPGQVLLQTHHPGHPLLATLLAGGYPAFAALALDERRLAGFPPFAYLALLRAEALDEAHVFEFLRDANALAGTRAADAPLQRLGPLPAPLARRAGRARAQLLLSAAQRPLLQAVLADWVPQLYALKSARKVRWSVDVDPYDLY